MPLSIRRGSLLGAGVLAVVFALASVAWACTVHQGNLWFCDTTNDPTGDCTWAERDTTFNVNELAMAKGDGFASQESYNLLYSEKVDAAMVCAAGIPFKNDQGVDVVVTPSGGGNAFGPTEVKMPAVANSMWDACAVRITANDSSHHMAFATTGL